MKNEITELLSESELAQTHDEMLQVALARPGVREYMEVFNFWKSKDAGLDAYRKATNKPDWTRSTSSTSSN